MMFLPFAARPGTRLFFALLFAWLPLSLSEAEEMRGENRMDVPAPPATEVSPPPVEIDAGPTILKLTNGDRLSGRLRQQTETHLYLETEFGSLRIPLDRVATISLERLDLSPFPDLPPVVDSLLDLTRPPPPADPPPGMAGTADAAPTEEADPAETMTFAEEILASPPPVYEDPPTMWDDNFFFRFLDRYNPLAHWDSQLQLGLVLQSGAIDQRDYSARLTTQNLRLDRREVRFEASWDYSLRRNEAGERFRWRDRRRAILRYRYNLSQRFFFESFTRYNSEFTQGIRHAVDESVGIGFTFLDTNNMRGAITPTIGAQYRDTRGQPTEWSGILSLFQDFEYRFTTRTKITESFSLTYYPAEDNEISVRLVTGLENQLSDRLRLHLRYEFSYDQTVANPTLRRQQLISFALGTTF